jgi:hypothetical protein
MTIISTTSKELAAPAIASNPPEKEFLNAPEGRG